MGQTEGKGPREITCGIPILKSCYAANKNQQGIKIADTNLRNSLMSGIVRKAYGKLYKINDSRILQNSNHQQVITLKRVERKISLDQEKQFKHTQHANIFKEQKDQLQRFLRNNNHQKENSNASRSMHKEKPNISKIMLSESKNISMESIQSMFSGMSSSVNLSKSIYQEQYQSSQPQTHRTHVGDIDFEKQILSLPNDVLFHILSFIMLDYSNLIQVGSLWYLKIHQAVDSYLLKVDNQFIKKYMKYFSFKNAYTSYSNYRLTLRQGFRLDRYVVAEIIPDLQNKIIILGYEFNFLGQKERRKHQFKFMVQKTGTSRCIWISLDQCSNNYDVRKQATVQPILPFCVGDNIKIAVNIFNMAGLIDVETLKFSDATFENLPSNIFQNNKSLRIPSYLEPPNADWILHEYCDQENKVKLDYFQPQIILKECRCRGFGLVTSRMVYQASEIGQVENMSQYLNINVAVKSHQEEITNEVQRVGLIHDMENTLELKQGDKFVIYYLKGGDGI